MSRIRRRLTPEMAVALTALFIALGGVGYAATGGTFILGQPNDATSQTSLTVNGTPLYGFRGNNTNTATGAPAARFEAPSGHAPFSVNRSTKVGLLNSDLVDGLDSGAFIRKGVAQSATPASGAAGVVDVTNTGNGNGIQGKTGDSGASGVYGENTTGFGYAIAGRLNGAGSAVFGDNPG